MKLSCNRTTAQPSSGLGANLQQSEQKHAGILHIIIKIIQLNNQEIGFCSHSAITQLTVDSNNKKKMETDIAQGHFQSKMITFKLNLNIKPKVPAC